MGQGRSWKEGERERKETGLEKRERPLQLNAGRYHIKQQRRMPAWRSLKSQRTVLLGSSLEACLELVRASWCMGGWHALCFFFQGVYSSFRTTYNIGASESWQTPSSFERPHGRKKRSEIAVKRTAASSGHMEGRSGPRSPSRERGSTECRNH